MEHSFMLVLDNMRPYLYLYNISILAQYFSLTYRLTYTHV